MVRTVTRKTPNTRTTWYRLGKSANKRIRRSSSSRRKELNKLKSMKKVTKRVLEEKLKRAYLKDGEAAAAVAAASSSAAIMSRPGYINPRIEEQNRLINYYTEEKPIRLNRHINYYTEEQPIRNIRRQIGRSPPIMSPRLVEEHEINQRLLAYRRPPLSWSYRRPIKMIGRNGLSSSSRRPSPRRASPISYPSSSASSVGKEYPECSVCFKNSLTGTLCDRKRDIYHPICRKCFNKVRNIDSKCPSCRKHINSLLNIPKDGSLKDCPPGKTLSRKGNCVKIWPRSPRRKSLNSGYELNRKTGRLRKVCPSGKKRSRKGRCVNKK